MPKALVYTAAGHSLGFGLAQVLSVIPKPRISPVPLLPAGHLGVIVHGQALYPVFDLGILLFDRPTQPELGIVAEVDGLPVVILAEVVRGVREGFRPVSDDPDGWMEGERGERALFPLVRPLDPPSS